jgi:uncharacterized DUF497 family protein
MYFEWDENKNRQNLLKHEVRFETAALVFDDPHALTQRDQSSDDEERWITLGARARRTSGGLGVEQFPPLCDRGGLRGGD